MKTIALYSIKGGVGKTAAATNLAYLAAKDRYSTLLCDLDPQGSASYYFKIRPNKKLNSKKLMKGGDKLLNMIRATDYENLDLLPADISYRNLDLKLDKEDKSSGFLKSALKGVKNHYDYILIDSPPNITLLSENIFNSADVVIYPFIPTTLSKITFDKLLALLKEKSMKTEKIHSFFSMVDSRKKLHGQIIAEMNQSNLNFLKTMIPFRSDIEKMGIYCEPIVHTKPRSDSAISFENLWMEIKTILQ
ncbi:MAG: ParA family protein [Candidatus Marinimicrobia bacterium]|nr:ParA family protein [Candidatus Neomarinimicrobiota bacterium]